MIGFSVKFIVLPTLVECGNWADFDKKCNLKIWPIKTKPYWNGP